MGIVREVLDYLKSEHRQKKKMQELLTKDSDFKFLLELIAVSHLKEKVVEIVLADRTIIRIFDPLERKTDIQFKDYVDPRPLGVGNGS